jgi:chromosome segregation ATPase
MAPKYSKHVHYPRSSDESTLVSDHHRDRVLEDQQFNLRETQQALDLANVRIKELRRESTELARKLIEMDRANHQAGHDLDKARQKNEQLKRELNIQERNFSDERRNNVSLEKENRKLQDKIERLEARSVLSAPSSRTHAARRPLSGHFESLPYVGNAHGHTSNDGVYRLKPRDPVMLGRQRAGQA